MDTNMIFGCRLKWKHNDVLYEGTCRYSSEDEAYVGRLEMVDGRKIKDYVYFHVDLEDVVNAEDWSVENNKGNVGNVGNNNKSNEDNIVLRRMIKDKFKSTVSDYIEIKSCLKNKNNNVKYVN